MPPASAWKIVLAVALLAAIVASAYARAPRRAAPGTELGPMVLAAVALYAVATLAWLTHHAVLAAVLCATGIAVSALAAWLSRGDGSDGGPRRGGEPADGQPPPDPDGVPGFDWGAFERDFRAYARERRTPERGDPARTR